MSDAREPRSIIEAAEKAAAAGNHHSAEQLLREAARLQEARLGPQHPDLANTLNNLGVVCEIAGKHDDAEQHFRRALTIATTALNPDHPFVSTSRKNLRDFCEAQGRPFELPAPPEVRLPAAAEGFGGSAGAFREGGKPDTTSPAAPPVVKVVEDPEDPEVVSKKFFSRVALGALGPIAMLMVVLAAGLPRLNSSGQPAPLPIEASSSPIGAAPSPEPTPTPASAPTSEPATVEPVLVSHESPAADAPTVVRASLCAEIEDWHCDPADRPVPQGPLFFYTQVTSARATTIEHRWYRDNHLSQSVELRVSPSIEAGYRTYSRYTMSGESGGHWRVELRSEDGALLHEERFTVQ
jgi:hypothetical protein